VDSSIGGASSVDATRKTLESTNEGLNCNGCATAVGVVIRLAIKIVAAAMEDAPFLKSAAFFCDADCCERTLLGILGGVKEDALLNTSRTRQATVPSLLFLIFLCEVALWKIPISQYEDERGGVG
jgi:hypothetical protein